jgi:hypothetical protein
MKKRFHPSRTILAALIVAAVFATTAFAFVDSFQLYTIEGYLDRAPDGARIVTRLDIGTAGAPRRQLFVTSYRRSGGLFEGRLSAERYLVRGNPADVLRLLGAPQGSAVKGTFAIYPQAIASLLIASLDRPA